MDPQDRAPKAEGETKVSVSLFPATTTLRVLCLSAHADDVEIGAGGTLLRLQKSYKLQATSIVLTGNPARYEEARRATQAFLGNGVECLHVGLSDGYLPAHWEEAKHALEDYAATAERPDLIFAPRREDAHQDHRVLAELTATVWRKSTIIRYAIPKWDGDWSSSTLYVPLSDEVKTTKLQLLNECFPSQHAHDWWDDELFAGVLRLNGMECRSQWAEGFTVDKLVWGMAK